ncbi:hypothetical protein AAGW05_14235 [Arthrobacter sp. LAPM80]|uniref:hypothetical protein n=1 Tax=Arthrobacter sp. LAPM80 TaxID=3141788 RepID=UPI00398A7B84
MELDERGWHDQVHELVMDDINLDTRAGRRIDGVLDLLPGFIIFPDERRDHDADFSVPDRLEFVAVQVHPKGVRRNVSIGDGRDGNAPVR